MWASAGALSCSLALAQSATPAVRIVSHIDESNLVTLKGNVNPNAIAKNDRGPVSGDLQMAGMSLVLSRSADQQAAFDAFVASQYDQSSPNFHQWLTPQQIGAQYGPAQADINTISGWLSSHGFAVKSIGADHMTIQFSGTAGQVESAFHTEIHNLNVNGAAHIANMSDPQIPAALATVVVGVKGLHNFFPHPLHRMGSKVHFNADSHGWVKLQSSPAASLAAGGTKAQIVAGSPHPNFYYPIKNSSGTTVAVEEDVAPYDFASIYNLPSGWPNSNNGSGQTISIIGTSDIDLSDVTQFKTVFGLPAGKTPIIAHNPADGDPGVCSGSTNICNGGDLDENSLDVEWSGAVAPGAQIVLVTDAYNSQTNPTNDPIFDGAQWVVDNVDVQGTAVYGSRIMSLSYGECELGNGTASNVAYNNLWQTAASAGIAVFVSTGDSGSPSCDDGGDQVGNPYEAQYGLSVSGLASTPWNTAVGGTDLNWCKYAASGSSFSGCSATDAQTYWNTSNSSQESSAKGYVPEIPWNDTCENPALLPYFQSQASGITTVPSTTEGACNFVYNYWLDIAQAGDGVIAPFVDTVGGSGGSSNCVVNDGEDTSSCSSSTTSTGSSYGNLTLVADGWPSPSWQAGSGVTGTSALTQRAIPDVSFFAGDGMFDSATLICVANDDAGCTAINNTGTSSTGGAEEVGGTSVATPEMAGVMALINAKAGSPQGNPNAALYTLAGKQTYSSCSAESGTTTSSCYFNDIDQGTIAMPCDYEGHALEGGAIYDPSTGEYEQGPTAYGLASPNCGISSSGDVVGTLTGYSAITGYDQATGLGSLNIANVVNAANTWTAVAGTGAASVTMSLSGVTSLQSTNTLSVSVTVSGSSGTPTGVVTLSATSTNGYSFAATLSSGTASFIIPANTFNASGNATLTATYSGNSTYASASTTASLAVTYIPIDTYTLASISNPAAIAPGASATATATVSSSNGYAGTVTLNCSLTGQPSGAANLPTCSASGTVALSATTKSGSATLTVTTTPSTTSELRKPAGRDGLFGAGGGAVLALLVFFGIPARRRSWRAMLGMVVLLVTLGSLAACGGGGSSGGGTTTIPGTTAGTYTFTVTTSGSPSSNPAPSAQTFTVTVN
jgi:subtilase family serine protease